jgi:uncharacterized membrane protein YhhN
LIAAAFVAIANWIAVGRDDLALERITKPLVIAWLLGAVVLAGPVASLPRWLLIVALGASLAGDRLLLPPGRFVAGLVAFLVAHLAYVGAFLVGPQAPGLIALALIVAAGTALTIGRRLVRGAQRVGLGGPVSGYLVAILAMAIAATGSGSLPAALGAWLFVVSDTILGWDRFAAGPPSTPVGAARRRLAVIVPYQAAQVLLTIAILGVAGA